MPNSASTTKTIEQSEFFPSVEPMDIYDALLSGPKHTALTGGGHATGSTKAGGKFTAWDGYIEGKNLELEPGVRILQEWTTSNWPEGAPASHLEWKFLAKDGGTEVKMTHSNVPASQAASYTQGWIDYYWKPMKVYFAR